MTNMDTFLKDEVQNESDIILREYFGGWRAYEQSAFHFTLIFKTGEIGMNGHSLFVEVDKELGFLHSKVMSEIQIYSVSDSEIRMKCKCDFSDFTYWRSKMTAALSL